MSSVRLRRLFACALVLALVSVAAPAGAAPTDERRARVAVRYLFKQQKPGGAFPGFSPVGSTADAVLAMVAAKRGPGRTGRALDRLAAQTRNGKVNSLGLQAKVVMAAVAGNRNPRRFGGRNLVWQIRQTEAGDGSYGDATVFDHALAMLASGAADRPPSDATVAWLLAAQCADGGWQFDLPAGPSDDEHCHDGSDGDWFQSDTNTTALAVQALAAATPSPAYEHDPFAFFEAIRDADQGGWGYTWGFSVTDANSTAMVLQAYEAAGRNFPAGSKRALRRLQYRLCGPRAGAFAYTWAPEDNGWIKTGPDAGATIGAVPGLLGVPLPVPATKVTKAPPKVKACG